MLVFLTKSKSVYSLDTENKIFNGGRFHNVRYINAKVIVGERAKIVLERKDDSGNHYIIKTSVVEKYM